MPGLPPLDLLAYGGGDPGRFPKLKEQTEFNKLYEAGLSRAIGDWLLGMNATRLYTLRYGQNRRRYYRSAVCKPRRSP